ncbi:RrF2 family transcriptional regulator [Paenibacillus hodogayensis]|uniref:RrF2 family transcriptional regulator n=1 Tax=Paenibacillus hodogayensis TaxID=279208 RepID=A0ABV5VU45_9BACL
MNSDMTVAIHSLVFLAYLPEHMASSESIASSVSTNPTRVRKIMSCLRAHGFVRTKEGIGGGYILNCDPRQVTLADIYRAFLCGMTLKPHWNSGDPEDSCLVSSNMPSVMDDIFQEAETQYQKCLEQMTIQNVLERVQDCKHTS